MNNKSRHILIFVPRINERVNYIFGFIFRNILGYTPEFTSDRETFSQSGKVKFIYSDENFSDGLFMKAHPVLFETSIRKQDTERVKFRDHTFLFKSSDDSFLPFDPFANAFCFLTRYEEYLPFQADEHGRFPDSENCLVKLNLHHKPVVDLMAYWIAGILAHVFPEFNPFPRKFAFQTSIDVDNAWAYRNKNLIRTVGAAGKAMIQGKFSELTERLAVLSGLKKDPYDSYDELIRMYSGHSGKLRFFFLMANQGRFDKSISYKNQQFRELIRRLSAHGETGIHPSYASNEKPELARAEKQRLEEILSQPVTTSRQHFLRLRFPETYRNLLAMGIRADYSMGFASMAGFRAGTCTAFPFFDLSLNTCTELMIHPFQLMDVALKNNLKLSPEEASLLIERLMNEVQLVNGTFMSLWHNESISNTGLWEDWQQVFVRMTEYGIKQTNE